MTAAPPVTKAPVIKARGVGRVLPGPVPVTLLDGIDLSIGEGEFVAITGPSGSGKSSLLYLLGLLDRPTSGSILLDGRDTARADAAELAGLRLVKLGFVFQFHFLLPEFTVLGNVMIPMRKLGGGSDAELRRRAEGLLEDLGLGDQMTKLPTQLSGGQRQRVAIARALANRPRVILADEPTGNLDTKSAQTVFDIFARLARETGTTVITVTHDEGLAAQTNRRVQLVDGRLVTHKS
ncbi:ATP-binding protein [Skermanella stibiiresistens SB22]|uniref:ATP-binding protein n=1 Tax=Skermanella stibiiresistens SB22 TaxID=1385369 RepID=W9H4B9_9PROT|nr:ABC transporter ATP-binding protein [Skermanella stibiiresistens]EWY41070.1 ATP-binding protein [Skermanella stibiiresistens SB22]